MPTKTIILDRVTLHVPDESKSTPVKFDRDGCIRSGHLHVDAIPPNQPATLDADEAEKILNRFGGREVDPDTGAVIREVRAANF